jgi:maltose/moltooligosaccharide transporter
MSEELTFSQKIKVMPAFIAKLFVVQFFTWFGLFAMWIYATPTITKYVFKTTDATTGDFEIGTSWVGYCFAFYSLLGAILGFYLPRFTKRFGKSKVHAVTLFVGGIGLILIYFIENRWLLFLPFVLIAIAWSSISTIPYHLVGEKSPDDKMDFNFSLFSFSVVIPQVTAATLLGFITKNFFNSETIFTIVLGGSSMLLASIIMFFIKDTVAIEHND